MGCIAAILVIVAGAGIVPVLAGIPAWSTPLFAAGAAWLIGSLALAVLGTAMDGARRKPATVWTLLRNWLIIMTAVLWGPLWLPFSWPLAAARNRARTADERNRHQEDWSSRRVRF